jgi:hypothetical protein
MLKVLGTILLGLVVLLGIAFPGGTTFTYRFRLAIEIDTPEGVRSGSSVMETVLRNNHGNEWAPPEARRFSGRTRGEAVFVDLGGDRNIIALLVLGPAGRDDLNFREPVAGALGVRWSEPNEIIPAIIGAQERRAILSVPSHVIPTLVTFHRLDDPDSAEVVQANELSRVFGSGYAFRQATIEMVPVGWWPANRLGLSGTPLTKTIEQKMPTILGILDKRSKHSRNMYPNQPYSPNISQFERP